MPSLEELLHELMERAERLASAHGRQQELLDAVMGVAGDVGLPTTLRRIVAAARSLCAAQYAALGVIGPDRRLVEFIYVGIGEQTADLISELPCGRGLLGLLIQDPRPLRLVDLTRHPEFSGFPDSHPHMRSFLGVPIGLRGEVFGNLYLADKVGGAEFTVEDESLLVGLAAAAAAAISSLRMYEEAQRRKAWLAAAAKITAAMLSAEPDGILDLVARGAREATGAELALIQVPAGQGGVLVEAADGVGAVTLRGRMVPVAEAPLYREVTAAGKVLVIEYGAKDERVTASLTLTDLSLGPVLAVPLGIGGHALGMLLIGNGPDAAPFSQVDLEMATLFAGQAVLTLEFSRAQRHEQRLVMFEDRERIARDLHDGVIQRLFAAGLKLQSLAPSLAGPDEATLIGAVGDLDQTIRDIRSTIFSLRFGEAETPTLRAQLLEIASNATQTLGYEPHVHLAGSVDRTVPAYLHGHLLVALQEALSNVARHAGASWVEVTVKVTGKGLTLVVRDDGQGMPGDGQGMASEAREGGLAHLRQRALDLGGRLTTGPNSDGPGLSLTWQVPLLLAE